jgi:phospho-N-acetylmuramoyl-pentapeptide-transferase
MLYHLFTYLDKQFDFPGLGLFQFISFRAGMAMILSLIITTVYGNRLISYLRYKQVGETVRNLGLEGQNQKQGTPTMGGLIIIAGILIPVLLFARIENIYIILMIITTVWMGAIGFLDDYIKVFKKNKEGLAGKFKIVGQVGLSLIIGWTMFFHPDILVRQTVSQVSNVAKSTKGNTTFKEEIFNDKGEKLIRVEKNNGIYYAKDVKSTITNIPFYKNNEFDYAKVLKFLGDDYQKYSLVVFLLFVIVIITAVSNGANITDGIDGLATGTSAIIGITLALLAYVSGNTIIADYLKIIYIPKLWRVGNFCSFFCWCLHRVFMV